MEKFNQRTWVEIAAKKLRHNLLQLQNNIGQKTGLYAVVKSNAYGHDLECVAKSCADVVAGFCVDSVAEAITLRRIGVKKNIIILGYTLKSRLADLFQYNLQPVVANFETLQQLNKLCSMKKKAVGLFLKIETGTSRQGIINADLPKFCAYIKKNKRLHLIGASTHFANIEDTTDHSYAERQLAAFSLTKKQIEDCGFSDLICHTACSAAAILFPETYFDFVRVGIAMYGLWPSPETKISANHLNKKIVLQPVLSWKTRIAQIKKLPAGAPVSYGCTEKLTRDSLIAVLPVGYYDGFDRKLSSVGNVLVRGKRCKILGRVCMNMCVIDVSDVAGIKLEDEVVIIGRGGGEEITAEEVAKKIGTINYEVITRINPTIPRIIV